MDDEARERYLLDRAEARRAQADHFHWAVPGLALAGQAFLLTIALGANVEPVPRLLASTAGMAILLASGHLMAKQAYHFDLYEAAIERERRRLGLPGLQLDALEADVATYPSNTSLKKRGWLTPKLKPDEATRWQRFRFRVVRSKAVVVWPISLGVLFVIDVFLAVCAVVELAGPNLAWLG